MLQINKYIGILSRKILIDESYLKYHDNMNNGFIIINLINNLIPDNLIAIDFSYKKCRHHMEFTYNNNYIYISQFSEKHKNLCNYTISNRRHIVYHQNYMTPNVIFTVKRMKKLLRFIKGICAKR